MMQPKSSPGLIGAEEALREEFGQVRGFTRHATPEEVAAALTPTLSALCFSGGGIRSAAYNLGVARALARYGLLKQFDYLSTVSGGGYIGGWLQTLIREEREVKQAAGLVAPHAACVAAVEAELSAVRPAALLRLRDFGNFLTPVTGMGSMDTWAGVALYLRNLLLNWLMLLPVLLLAVVIPVLHRTAIWQAATCGTLTTALMVLAWIALVSAVTLTCEMLPSHRAGMELTGEMPVRRSVRVIVAAALTWAVVAPVGVQWAASGAPEPASWLPVWLSVKAVPAWLLLPLLQFMALMVGFMIAWIWTLVSKELFGRNFWRWLIASLGSSAVLAIVIGLALPPLTRGGDTAAKLTQFGPLVLVLLYMVQTSFYVGLRRESLRADLDREWLARMDGAILAAAVGWAVFAFTCVSMGPLMESQFGWSLTGSGGGATATGAMAAGGAAAWMARQAKSWAADAIRNPSMSTRLMALLPSALSAIFLVGLLAVLGMLVQEGIGNLVPWLLPNEMFPSLWAAASGAPGVIPWLLPIETFPSLWGAASGVPSVPPMLKGWVYVPALAVLVVLCWALIFWFKHININRFSMHGTYRNRLARAFLGTARQDDRRSGEWFTGFDDADSKHLALLRAGEGETQALFPVINMALNRSADGPTGQAERMAVSYTATPLHCGAVALETRKAPPVPGFIATEYYAGQQSLAQPETDNQGITLASVITASGAAASPHWGYHTSPLTAFVMTLFNVRLGLWLPNPTNDRNDVRDLRQNRPPNAIRALLADLMGRTTLENRAIYLSDGGHFDNLGLYEMLRRRCELIVVVDVGADPDCAFFDLGMAIRKAEIDLPVRVSMDPMRIRSRAQIEEELAKDKRTDALAIATGRIEYLHAVRDLEAREDLSEAEAEIERVHDTRRSGRLVYIKPSLLDNTPTGVRAYARENAEFPHETTGDQFFSESQFESYHVLGWHQANQIAKEAQGTLAGLFAAAATHCGTAPPAGAQR